MSAERPNESYDDTAPLFRALTEVRLTLGLPDMFAYTIWMTMPVVAYWLANWRIALLALPLHLAGLLVTRYDRHGLLIFPQLIFQPRARLRRWAP